LRQQIAIDWGKVIKALILLCFSILLFYLVISGQIRMYINPRFTILSELAAVALFLMSAVQFFNMRNNDHRPPYQLAYVIFIIPLALALLLPDVALDASVASNRGFNFNSGNSASAPPGSGALAQAPAGSADPGESAGLLPDNPGIGESEPIRVTADNYVRVIDAISQAPEDYAGRKIEMLGFIIRDKDLAPREFGLIRFIITCCTADASPEGFILKSKDALGYKDGTWINIRGVLEVDDFDQQVVPVIEATSVELAAEPADPYVYP
jgi:putative membrane protein